MSGRVWGSERVEPWWKERLWKEIPRISDTASNLSAGVKASLDGSLRHHMMMSSCD